MSYVSRTGNCDYFAGKRFAARFQHFLSEIHRCVSGGFRANQRTAPVETFTGKNAFESVSDSLVSTIDLPKTILNVLGVKEKFHPETFQGHDITPILNDPNQKIRERLLIEHDEEIAKDKIMRLRTLVTEKHRLTVYDGHDNLGDIFNYKSDPDEVNNLWNTDKELRNKLSEELLREIIKVRPRFPKRNAYN